MNSSKPKMSYKQGFTLIELLVVVLIIGILTAVAVPQYKKAVEKTRAVQAITLLNGVYQAYENFYLANGTYPTLLSQLDISAPWTGNVSFAGASSYQSSSEWALELQNGTDNSINGVCIGRISGTYKGTGFCRWKNPQNVSNAKPGKLYCIERKLGNHIYAPYDGSYCQKIMGATAGIDAISGRFKAFALSY